MSLVAYASSDDSDASEVEDNAPPIENINKIPEPKQVDSAKASAISDPVETNDSISSDQISDEDDDYKVAAAEAENDRAPHSIPSGSAHGASVEEPHISDEEDFLPVLSRSSGLNLPTPKHAPQGVSNDSSKQQVVEGEGSILAGLPQPRAPAVPKLAAEDEEELEDFVKKKVVTEAEKPPPPPKPTKTVKITIPDLPTSDSDEEGEPSTKKTKKTSGSGLFSLLPAPKNAVTKETKRSFVPHTLSRNKPTKPTPAPRKVTSTTAVTALSSRAQAAGGTRGLGAGLLPGVPDDDSEDEDEEESVTNKQHVDTSSSSSSKGGMNFFGVTGAVAGGDSSASKAAVAMDPIARRPLGLSAMNSISSLPPSSSSMTTDPSTVPPGTVSDIPLPAPASSSSSSSSSKSAYTREGAGGGAGVIDPADAPLTFKASTTPTYPAPHRYGGGPMRQSSWEGNMATHPNVQYNLAAQYEEQEEEEEDDDQPQVGGVAMETSEEGETSSGLSEQEQFLRLQGKKNFGKEAINIIDVHQDNQLDKDEMLKQLSEEQPTQMMSHSKKKNKDMPSGQQKRKHQITYLAFKAKEDELNLKNQWAQNKSNKRAAANKYGF